MPDIKIMTVAEVMNTLVKQNIDVSKVIELSNKIEVNKEEIVKPPMIDTTPTWMRYVSPSNFMEVVYEPLYDTYILGRGTNLFTESLAENKSYELTNMKNSARLPIPCMYVVKGFSLVTNISEERLSKVIMSFQVLSKIYAEMPLSHLPFEFPDNRIIIPSGGYFRVQLRNEGEETQDKLVFFINGWELRAVQ